MLHYAIDQNDWVTLSQIIDSGCSVNTQGDKGFTPIHHAIMKRDLPVNLVQRLVSLASIYLPYKNNGFIVDSAIKEERWDIVDMVVESGFAMSENKRKKLLKYQIALTLGYLFFNDK